MKKYFLLILLIAAACTAGEPDRRNVRFVESMNSNEVRYMKPSEVMQVGTPKGGILDCQFCQYLSDSRDEPSLNSNPGQFKVGNPYQISGVAYFPQNYVEFEEVGMASWYGDDFHGKQTANGEIYDTNAMTAAHPTLPLPSMVRVTNLRNGRSVIVRVNDRGPFAKERIIDVSEKAAEELGFKDQGATKVYIQLLRDDADQMIKNLQIKN